MLIFLLQKKTTQRANITKIIFTITYQIQVMDLNICAETVLNKNVEVFVAYISSFVAKITIHLARKF